ncbi:unnamed protein product [Parnassius apollo]|uniref:(apollo) hypothetical protein n=1 Tax=Parnassius apollo TaxID=110799 RepID=A0A8S3XBV5_PARAO|nr:unnamed protein product [Parnassius apollo]
MWSWACGAAGAGAGRRVCAGGGSGAESVRRPRVQCDGAELAGWLAAAAAHAARLHRDLAHTLRAQDEP